MDRDKAREYLLSIAGKIGCTAIEYLTDKDEAKMREAIDVLYYGEEPMRPICCMCGQKKGTHGIAIRKPITHEMLLNHDLDNMNREWYCDECFKVMTDRQKLVL